MHALLDVRRAAIAARLAIAAAFSALVFALPATAPAQSPARQPAAAEPQRSPETVERIQKLSSELRCLVCQNQTLADSNADLAVDLRRQVEGMIDRGDSDEKIKSYLVERYGDFVLYRPPVQGNTALLWYGPFALLLIGAVVWFVVQRRSRRSAPAAAAADAPSADAQPARDRARQLLDD